jgi:predicted GH43/DUF377 family glycosyl hydrolase
MSPTRRTSPAAAIAPIHNATMFISPPVRGTIPCTAYYWTDRIGEEATMADLARRFDSNPILRPEDVVPSRDGLEVECLLNPGAFRYQGKTGLLLRVAEWPLQKKGWVSTPILDPLEASGISILTVKEDDPDFEFIDPRVFRYKGQMYLTTLSHLRLAWSDDGVHFVPDRVPTLLGQGPLESFGIEDCRVTQIEDVYHLTFTAVSPSGVGVGLITTRDWRRFDRHGMIIPPSNKDCALFPEKIGGEYLALHRPSGVSIGGNFIWLSRSPDLHHWGYHECIAWTRPGMWDSARIGAGAEPIRTPQGWLAIYHGANEDHRYCLGGMLLDLENPAKVLARSKEPIMEPLASYEQTGFFGNVVFTNGHVVDGDTVTLYYGASDEVICGACLSVREILDSLSAA